MRRLLLLASLCIGFGLGGQPAHAVDVSVPAPVLSSSPLLITGYQVGVDGATPQYLELYNSSNTALDAREWLLTLTWQAGTAGQAVATPFAVPLASTQQYIPAKGYVVVGFGVAVPNASILFEPVTGEPGNYLAELRVASQAYLPYVKTFSVRQSAERMRLNPTSTGYTTTGNYSKDDREGIYDSGLYVPRDSFPLAPIEILANPKTCSPLDTDTSCKEYVKFYNNTSGAVDFEGTRIRAGSSMVALGGKVEKGQYATFTVSLPNGGDYVWLEDSYGVRVYENTVVEYANASAASKKGKSWALFDGAWDWATPNPGGPNTPLPPLLPKAAKTKTLTPCRADQYRNPETNRCKLIASASSSLKPCAANQYRNPETNRCRLIASAGSTLKPCAANQYRNPETNRCRLISSASASLKPCLPGQERNPATNRCRKVVSSAVPGADFGVTNTPDAAKNAVGWLAFAGVGAVAVGYGAWEWRRELGELGAKIKGVFKK